jgi:sugar lactone lactonase YvrE
MPRAAAACLLSILLFSPLFHSAAGAQTVSTYVSGITSASDLEFDSSGNLYVTGVLGSGTAIFKVGPGGGPVTTFASGFTSAFGLAIQPSGEVYVTERFSGKVWKLSADGATRQVYASGFTDPLFLHFDGTGDLYVGEWAARNLKRVSPDGVVTMYAPLLTASPTLEVGDFVIMPGGEIYVGAGPDIKLIAAGGAPVTTVASGLGGVVGIRRNDDGSFFVSKGAAHTVFYVSPSGVGSIIHGPGLGCVDGPIATANFSQPDGMRIHGNVLYIADRACNRVRTIDLSGSPTPVTRSSWGSVKQLYR